MYLSFCAEERAGGGGGGEAWKFGRVRFEFVWVEGHVVQAAYNSDLQRVFAWIDDGAVRFFFYLRLCRWLVQRWPQHGV